MKFCKNCFHFDSIFKECNRPNGELRDLVSGKVPLHSFYASNERAKPIFFRKDRCGPDAKYFRGKL